MGSLWRYLGAAIGFGFGVVWMTAGLGSAIVAVLLAALGYGVVFTAERAQASAAVRRTPNEARQSLRDRLAEFELDNHERGDVEPQVDERARVGGNGDYGWPVVTTATP